MAENLIYKKRYKCPFCLTKTGNIGSRPNLSIDFKKKIYYCFRCQSKGKVTDSLLKLLNEHDINIENIQESESSEIPNNQLSELWKGSRITGYESKNIFTAYLRNRNMSKEAFSYFSPRVYINAIQPAFNNRILFPFTVSSRILGYTGRSIMNNNIPYLHTIGLPRKFYFFNEDVLQNITDRVYIVEGIFDLIGVGYKITVAGLGKNLTEIQLQKLTLANTKELIFCLDGDAWIDSLSYALTVGIITDKKIGYIKLPAGEDPNTINVLQLPIYHF